MRKIRKKRRIPDESFNQAARNKKVIGMKPYYSELARITRLIEERLRNITKVMKAT
ncbi:MAG TPA: hypothetical protein PK894_06320 [Defluviitoga sp.]|nr:hypothetical protein [Defluviitoga sp.]HPZ29281.1 hypothetical protein [Defluviitoga sp.]HQD63191.1 hypothetical protein [Defluviitoga sp.]